MEMDERPPRGKGKKRGPYKKWIALKEHFIVETDSSNTLCGTSKKAIEDHAKTFNRADDLFFLDPSTAYCEEQHTQIEENIIGRSTHIAPISVSEEMDESDCTTLPDSTPQADEDMTDTMWNELCGTLMGEMNGHVHDSGHDSEHSSGLQVLADQIGYTIQNDYEEVQVQADETLPSDEKQPMFEGSTRCLGVVVLLVCCFMIRFRLSDEAANYMLNLTYLLLPPSNRMIRTMYHLQKYIKGFVKAPIINYYCATCYTHVDKNTQTCPNTHCLKDLTPNDSISYFIQHSLIAQLQIMFSRKGFTENVRNYRFHHYMQKEKHEMKDVYDGELYLDLFERGFLNDPNSLSFAMNTDGVPVFKSSKVSMWPVYLIVNELPISQRKLRENVLLYGIWVSSKKPVMWSFLKPLYADLAQLEDGVVFNDHNNSSFTCHATLLTVTCDLPARCLVSNSTQFNGKFGCWHCLQEGESTVSGKGHCWVFPYNDEGPKGPPRTLDTITEDVKHVIDNIKTGQSSYTVRGIKGPTWFMFLKYFCITKGFVIDYMHGVCGGIMKLLLTVWFTKDYKHCSYSYYEKVTIVNGYLRRIKPTLDVSRVPRSIDELLYWKSSEFRNFLLFWGIPVLKNVLHKEHYLHFCILSKAIHKLLSQNINQEDLHIAEQSLFLFVQLFTELYEKRFMTMNVHQLVHLVDSVRATGPLFTANCFVFEDLNGFILQHFHGTTGVETQILDAISMIQVIPVLKEKYLLSGSDEAEFYQSMMSLHNRKKYVNIENGVYSVGSTNPYTLSEDEYVAVTRIAQITDSGVVSCNKIFMEKNNLLVYSSNYTRIQRRDQSVIKYVNEGGLHAYGRVSRFIQCREANAFTNLALVIPLVCQSYDMKDPVHLVVEEKSTLAIHIPVIQKVCFFIKVENETFISEMPNCFELD
ncbi:uncharacterized protein [Ambystoma mexicanum]|uniref:uncharacterized protein n=1 Tax=Ambystoma mexicanum TaxID=8296 RepID=UPI0037E70A4B